MEKPKFHLNPNEEIVKTIREGLKRTGGYCPCRLQHIPENICICKEFKEQLADPDYHGACHCGVHIGGVNGSGVGRTGSDAVRKGLLHGTADGAAQLPRTVGRHLVPG